MFTSCICLLLARFPRGISAQRGDVIGGTNTFCAGVATPVVSGRLAACRGPVCQQPDATASPVTAWEEPHLAWAERSLLGEINMQVLHGGDGVRAFHFWGLSS